MWVTPPPMIDPRMPSTIVQKIVMVHVHHRFRDNPRDQPNKNIPDYITVDSQFLSRCAQSQ
jgi:hypothetical protein